MHSPAKGNFMIKGTLTHKNTRTKTEKIKVPDTVNAGDIIHAIAKSIRNFDYDDCIDRDTFEIVLENGLFFYCEQLNRYISKYSLYVEELDEDGEYYNRIADFIL